MRHVISVSRSTLSNVNRSGVRSTRKEPVAAPGDVSHHFAIAGNVHGDRAPRAKTDNVAHPGVVAVDEA